MKRRGGRGKQIYSKGSKDSGGKRVRKRGVDEGDKRKMHRQYQGDKKKVAIQSEKDAKKLSKVHIREFGKRLQKKGDSPV